MRGVEPGDDGGGIELREHLDNDCAQGLTVVRALEIGAETLVRDQFGTLEHGFAEIHPFTFVLQPDHHRASVT
ncbi:hypothetical protein D3C81_2220310 [compost metagenome]